ncbi:MAG: hypothetical protein M0R66_06855 [Candidatus Omnitrophica bacterium]|jgi:hypothetical protein|nr:hypothetical protein [Candidatus Omnitrophota bacterium]
MRARRPSEAELGRAVRDYFRDAGWDTWAEVTAQDRRCDLVARRGPVLTAIEIKTSWTMALFEQAIWWRHCAHRVYAAAPCRPEAWAAVSKLAAAAGIGLLQVANRFDGTPGPVEELIAAPTFARPYRPKALADALLDGQREGADPGCLKGWHTPFHATVDALKGKLAEAEGRAMKLRDLIDAIRHHYASHASAMGAIAKWIRLGKIKGIRLEYRGRYTWAVLEEK